MSIGGTYSGPDTVSANISGHELVNQAGIGIQPTSRSIYKNPHTVDDGHLFTPLTPARAHCKRAWRRYVGIPLVLLAQALQPFPSVQSFGMI